MTSLLSALGYINIDSTTPIIESNTLESIDTNKKDPFILSNDDLSTTRDKLVVVKNADINVGFHNTSWKYTKYWIKNNPRLFDAPLLVKIRDSILDKDIAIRRTYSFVKSEIKQDWVIVDHENNFIDCIKITKIVTDRKYKKLLDDSYMVLGCLAIANFTCAVIYSLYN